MTFLVKVSVSPSEFLELFYVTYGSFIPLSETDVLEHLKNKCNTDFIDKKLNIHLEVLKYKAGLASIPMNCFKVDYNKHTLTLEDLSTLDDQNWVNDQVINMYGELIMEATEHKVHFFNSFFHRQLVAKGYEGVKRWTKKVDLFSKSLLLIPIHLEIHWSLITVDMANHHIHYYDSQGIVFKYTIENIMRYILAEAKEKKQATYQNGWKMIINKGIPQQKNDSDCGVFVLEYCKCLALKEPLQFTQDDMPKVRKRIYKELCDCKLSD
uniref:Ubiquitin-like protease family profile domain-containing protein n=1 Tax=Oncorhynchus mykiss TaxID=8022 RepID=A0A8C7PHN8_ONCMY